VGAASLQKEILKNRHQKRRKIKNIEEVRQRWFDCGVRVGNWKQTYAREISTQFKEQLNVAPKKMYVSKSHLILST